MLCLMVYLFFCVKIQQYGHKIWDGRKQSYFKHITIHTKSVEEEIKPDFQCVGSGIPQLLSKTAQNSCHIHQTVLNQTHCLFRLRWTHTGWGRLLRAALTFLQTILLDHCGFTLRHLPDFTTKCHPSLTSQSFPMTSITWEIHCRLLQSKCCYLYFYCIYNGLQALGTLLWVLPCITATLLCHQTVLCNEQQTSHQVSEGQEHVCLTDVL